MISVIPVSRPVPLILNDNEFEIYTNGIFLTKEGWNKVEINESRLQEEVRLLRVELSKFEEPKEK